jgi:hypothetical protein
MMRVAGPTDRAAPGTESSAVWRLAMLSYVEALVRWEERIAPALSRGDLDLSCRARRTHEVSKMCIVWDGGRPQVYVHSDMAFNTSRPRRAGESRWTSAPCSWSTTIRRSGS